VKCVGQDGGSSSRIVAMSVRQGQRYHILVAGPGSASPLISSMAVGSADLEPTDKSLGIKPKLFKGGELLGRSKSAPDLLLASQKRFSVQVGSKSSTVGSSNSNVELILGVGGVGCDGNMDALASNFEVFQSAVGLKAAKALEVSEASLGSQYHKSGICAPCRFQKKFRDGARSGSPCQPCYYGAFCNFCHIDHPDGMTRRQWTTTRSKQKELNRFKGEKFNSPSKRTIPL